MGTKDVDFRPSLLSGDHKGFVAALSTDEYNARRRLVTEAALTELGSTTSALSNFHPSGHRYRMREITSDAECPQRGFAVLAKNCLTGIAFLALVASGIWVISAHVEQAEVPEQPASPHPEQGFDVERTPQKECAIRDTTIELARDVVQPSTPYAVDQGTGFHADATDCLSPRGSACLSDASNLNNEALRPWDMPAPSIEAGGDGETTESVVVPSSQVGAYEPDMQSVPAAAGICTSVSTDRDACLETRLLDTTCLPTVESGSIAEQQPLPQQATVVEDEEAQQHMQRPVLPHELEQILPSQKSGLDHPPAGLQGPGDDEAPVGTPVRASFELEELHQSTEFANLVSAMPPPALVHSHSMSLASRLSDHIDALFASRDMKDFYSQLLRASAHPQGALIMWAAVLTPLLTIFAICFVVSVSLHAVRTVLGGLSNICSASSHFTMQRLGAITRKLMLQTHNAPEDMVMLELQAAVAKREADCRAKDEQLASLKLLLDGLQLELQRCNDAEKELTCKYKEALEELARMRKHHTARQSDRSRSDSSSRSTQIPGPALPEPAAPPSGEASACSDTESDRGAAGRLRLSSASPSAVPAPPRLGRISAAATCSGRAAQARRFATAASTPPLSDVVSPSSDCSEAGFATCAPAPLASGELC